MRVGSLGRKWGVFAPPVLEAGDVDTYTTDIQGPPANAIDVEPHQKLRTRWFGRDAADEAGEAQFYGWYEDGPGHLIGKVSFTLGAFQLDTDFFPDQMSPPVRDLFDPSKTWLEVDTYVLDSNPESILSMVSQTDSTGFLQFDLSNALYRYILAEINVGTALELGALWVPIG